MPLKNPPNPEILRAGLLLCPWETGKQARKHLYYKCILQMRAYLAPVSWFSVYFSMGSQRVEVL